MKIFVKTMLATALLTLANLAMAQAQAQAQAQDSLLKGISIRKTFTGSDKDKVAPAALTFVDSSDEKDTYNIDFGIKKSWDWDPVDRPLHDINGAMAIEYHRNSSELDGLINKRSLSLQADNALAWMGSNDLANEHWFNELSYTLTRDSHNNRTSRDYQYLTGFYLLNTPWAPGYLFEKNGGEAFLQYMVTTGFSRIGDFTVEDGVGKDVTKVAEYQDESFWVTNVTANIWPFPDTFTGQLILTVGYQNLHLMGGSPTLGDNSEKYSASLNYFLDDARNISIGIDYENGEDQLSNFRDLERTSIGFKIKFG